MNTIKPKVTWIALTPCGRELGSFDSYQRALAYQRHQVSLGFEASKRITLHRSVSGGEPTWVGGNTVVTINS